MPRTTPRARPRKSPAISPSHGRSLPKLLSPSPVLVPLGKVNRNVPPPYAAWESDGDGGSSSRAAAVQASSGSGALITSVQGSKPAGSSSGKEIPVSGCASMKDEQHARRIVRPRPRRARLVDDSGKTDGIPDMLCAGAIPPWERNTCKRKPGCIPELFELTRFGWRQPQEHTVDTHLNLLETVSTHPTAEGHGARRASPRCPWWDRPRSCTCWSA